MKNRKTIIIVAGLTMAVMVGLFGIFAAKQENLTTETDKTWKVIEPYGRTYSFSLPNQSKSYFIILYYGEKRKHVNFVCNKGELIMLTEKQYQEFIDPAVDSARKIIDSAISLPGDVMGIQENVFEAAERIKKVP